MAGEILACKVLLFEIQFMLVACINSVSYNTFLIYYGVRWFRRLVSKFNLKKRRVKNYSY